MKIKKHHLLTINKLLIEAAVAIGFTLIIWLIYVSVSVANNKVQIGSSYMTMNNEFYPLLNEQVANYVEERKGLLYSRDPALSVNKQVDGIIGDVQGAVSDIAEAVRGTSTIGAVANVVKAAGSIASTVKQNREESKNEDKDAAPKKKNRKKKR